VTVGADGVVSVGTSATNTKKDLALAKVGVLQLALGAGADVLSAGAAPLPIAVYGGADNDVLATGSANDILDGGDGDDTLKGGAGDDWLDGGGGDDTLDGQGGCDGCFGGLGADTNLDDEATARIEQVEFNFAKGREACESSGFGGPATGDYTPPPNGGGTGGGTTQSAAGALTTKAFDGVEVEFSYIPSGTFKMGSPESDADADFSEKTQHNVTISKAFLMARTEVTQELWQAVMGSHPSRITVDNKRPVDTVSWNDAQAFLLQLNRREGVAWKYRLPTEAEWEYAARAGTTTVRYGTLDDIAWYSGNSNNETHAVKGKTANAWNLYDMVGNVWEWTGDWWTVGWNWRSAYWPSTALTDPYGPATGSDRVYRGGGYSGDASSTRIANRLNGDPELTHATTLGFRPARSLP
jgi:formylglycine-generating enzyme required for sulfatase activity